MNEAQTLEFEETVKNLTESYTEIADLKQFC